MGTILEEGAKKKIRFRPTIQALTSLDQVLRSGEVDGAEFTPQQIFMLLVEKADVFEKREDGTEVRITFENYNTDNSDAPAYVNDRQVDVTEIADEAPKDPVIETIDSNPGLPVQKFDGNEVKEEASVIEEKQAEVPVVEEAKEEVKQSEETSIVEEVKEEEVPSKDQPKQQKNNRR